MRIAGINPGTTPRYAGFTAEAMWMVVRNTAGSTIPNGGCVVPSLAGDAYTDANGISRPFGYDVAQPATATLPIVLGAAHGQILDDEFGEIQTWGYDIDTYVNVTAATPVPTNADGIVGTNGVWYWSGGGAVAAGDKGVIVETAASIISIRGGSNGQYPLGCFLTCMGT